MPSLSPIERLLLTNQCRILIQITTSQIEREYFADLIKVIDGGFEREYDRFLTRFMENGLSVEEGTFVEDTLLMLSSLLEHRRLTDLDLGDFAYPAFDPGEEYNHLAYARYLYELDRHGYPGLKGIVTSREPQLGRYRAMVIAWRESHDLPELNASDLSRIVAVGEHAG